MRRMFLLLIMPMTLSACAQKNNIKIEDIKEIWVYDYFHPRGYTTAGAFGQIMRLEEEGVAKFKLDQSDTDSLCRILQETSSKKLFQTKTGQYLIFVEFVLENEQNLKAFIARGAISVDFKKDYIINDTTNRKWLINFIDRMYEEYGK